MICCPLRTPAATRTPPVKAGLYAKKLCWRASDWSSKALTSGPPPAPAPVTMVPAESPAANAQPNAARVRSFEVIKTFTESRAKNGEDFDRGCRTVREEFISHGWTRMHTDQTRRTYPCESVSIRGSKSFLSLDPVVHGFMEAAEAAPEFGEEIEVEGVGAVGEGALGRVMDF